MHAGPGNSGAQRMTWQCGLYTNVMGWIFIRLLRWQSIDQTLFDAKIDG